MNPARTAGLLSMLLGIAACRSLPPAGGAQAAAAFATIRPVQLAVAGVGIGSSEKEVLRAFGQPATVKEESSGITGKPSRLLTYPGVEVDLVGGEVYNLKCSTPAYATRDSLRVGDSVEKVLRVYGQGERQGAKGGDLLRFNVTGNDTALLFHLQQDHIAEIELWFDYT